MDPDLQLSISRGRRLAAGGRPAYHGACRFTLKYRKFPVLADDRTRVVIVDDHMLVREGLRRILQAQADVDVVGEAGDSAAAVAAAARERPDVVLLDVEIPGGEAVGTVRKIRDASPESRVIILSMHEGPRLVQDLLDAGIRGYLLKSIH